VLHVNRFDFIQRILSIARFASHFNFSVKNLIFSFWLNDLLSFSTFSVRVFVFSDLIECQLILNLSQFSWQRQMRFEKLREFFLIRYFAVFEACFEIVFDFFIKFLNRNLILHLCRSYITDDLSLMIILIQCFVNDWLNIKFSSHLQFFCSHVLWN
jgi:hypothetical protein